MVTPGPPPQAPPRPQAHTVFWLQGEGRCGSIALVPNTISAEIEERVDLRG